MELIIVLIVAVLFTVAPVMMAARALGARKSGFWICLLAVICSSLVSGFLSELVLNYFLSLLIAFAATALIYSVILGATFLKSLLIALLSIAIQVVIVLIISWLGVLSMSVP